MPAITMSNCWLEAEKKIFGQLVTGISGSVQNVNAFRGFLPNERDAWALFTGGMATGPIERLYGTTAAWCSLSIKAKIECNYFERDKCLEFGGKLLSLLQEKSNFHGIGNVMWFRLADLPNEPQMQIIPNDVGDAGAVNWLMTTPMELVIATGAEY